MTTEIEQDPELKHAYHNDPVVHDAVRQILCGADREEVFKRAMLELSKQKSELVKDLCAAVAQGYGTALPRTPSDLN